MAFFSDGDLKEIGIDGSGPRLIARGPFRDGAWNADGVVLVGGQLGRPLMRVSQLGGEPVAETALDQSPGETSHDYPEFLPDGRHYIFMARRGVRTDDLTTYVGTLGSSERRQLPGIRSAVKYSPSGHLLFLRGTTLMAQAFSSDRLELSGDAFPIAEQVAGTRVATFSISQTGTLAFIGGSRRSRNSRGSIGSAHGSDRWALPARTETRRCPMTGGWSPLNAGRLLMCGCSMSTRMAASKLTSDRSEDRQPVWSPNGQALAFASDRGGSEGLYERSAEVGGDDRLLLQSDAPMALSDWSPDGNYLTYAAGGDVWALPLSGARTPLQLTTSPFFQELGGDLLSGWPLDRLSVGRVQQHHAIGRGRCLRAVVSATGLYGGKSPPAAGSLLAGVPMANEIFYLAPDGMLMAVPVAARGPALDVGIPKPLFRPRFTDNPLSGARYDVANDGRFLRSRGGLRPVDHGHPQLARADEARPDELTKTCRADGFSPRGVRSATGCGRRPSSRCHQPVGRVAGGLMAQPPRSFAHSRHHQHLRHTRHLRHFRHLIGRR